MSERALEWFGWSEKVNKATTMVQEDSQQSLILYLVWICRRQRFSRYSIGLGSRRGLDDVSLELFHEERRYLYLFSLKDRHYTKQNISYETLASSSSELGLAKYFEAYLNLKLESSEVHEIAVWTGAKFRKKDSKVQQMLELSEDQSRMLNLLEDGMFGVERYRIKSSESLEEILLKLAHPLYKLAAKIARLLLAKLPISSNNIPKGSFNWLLVHVFEENRFKDKFIAENSTLPKQTQQFREYLDTELHHQFQRKQINDFQLARIKLPPYSSNIEIILKDDYVKRDSWKYMCNFETTTTKEDVRRFLSSLVFYTNVPNSYNFSKLIYKQCNFNEEICYESRRFFRSGVVMNENQINAIFELFEFRRINRRRTYSDFQFKDKSWTVLAANLNEFCASQSARLLILKAEGNVQMTLDRIAIVAEEFLTSSRFIFVKDSRTFDKLLLILERLESVRDELTIVIVPYKNDSNSLSKIQSFTKFCRIILVADRETVIETGEEVICRDIFSFDDFSNETQDRLLSKNLIFQGREYLLSSLLNDASLSKIPIETVLDWNASDVIFIGSGPVRKVKNESFIERNIYSENPVTLNYAIICGEPGIGKSTLLEKMAIESQHMHCVSVVWNCRNKSNLFESGKDIFNVLLSILDVREGDSFKIFLLKTLIEERRIHILLDDFDDFDKVDIALQWLNNLNLHSMVITTKRHLEEFLKKNWINSSVYYLKPFEESDQLSFLKHRWKSNGNDEKQLKNTLEFFRSVFEGDFLKIPANLEIAAMLHEEHNFQIDTVSAAKIVKAFIDKKFKLCTDQYFDLSYRGHEIALKALRNSFEVDHAKLAYTLECELNVDYDVCKNLHQYGMLRIKGGKVSFVDCAFQEFFIVKFLLTHNIEQEYFNRLIKIIFTDFNSRLAEFLDYHMTCFENIQELLSEPKAFKSTDCLPLRPNLKLNVIKARQLYNFFQLECSEEQLIDFIYTSITNNKFHIFEAIYDSLPNPLFNRISFKFGSYATNSGVIDLSTLNEDKIVALLKILLTKHPNDFVQKIFASFANCEQDFVTTSILKGYKIFIEQLFCINQSLKSVEELECLQDYIEQHWKEYLMLAIFNNRIEIVEIVLSCLVKKYHQRVIKGFLMEQNFLHVFAEVCRDADESAVEIVQVIVEFVESNLSDYDLSTIVKRKHNGSNFEELVGKIISEKLRTVFELFCQEVV